MADEVLKNFKKIYYMSSESIVGAPKNIVIILSHKLVNKYRILIKNFGMCNTSHLNN